MRLRYFLRIFQELEAQVQDLRRYALRVTEQSDRSVWVDAVLSSGSWGVTAANRWSG